MTYKCDICRGLVEDNQLSYITIHNHRTHGHHDCLYNHLQENKDKFLNESEKTQTVKKTNFLCG